MVIVGGGTAGWITAALLVKVLGNAIRIKLVESEEIGTVGVGEATIPPIRTLNSALGIDEADFLKATGGTMKLGIEFEGWNEGAPYMHAFGGLGKNFPFCSFHHFWRRSVASGRSDSLWDYSLNRQAAKRNRFAKIDRVREGNLQGLVYAYHFDAGLYARYLRRFSESLGVTRIEGIIDEAVIEPESGFVHAVRLRGGGQVDADLFVDCSGMRGLLIEEAMGVGFEDWRHWLPCDRAIAVPSETVKPLNPYTRATAHDAGWRWRIPLQHRVGNGLVYSSRYLSDDEAGTQLLAGLDGAPVDTLRIIPFRTGRRVRQWHGNCVAIGLSGGFLEPLESTSIHLIQSAAVRLIRHFPHSGFKQSEIDEYNRQSNAEYDHIRDFIILHYHLNNRRRGRLWEDCRRMAIPESLARRIRLFRDTGKVFREQDELFSEIAWQQVMIGQGLVPEDYHPVANTLGPDQLEELLDNLKRIVDHTVGKLPAHERFLEDYCGYRH